MGKRGGGLEMEGSGKEERGGVEFEGLGVVEGLWRRGGGTAGVVENGCGRDRVRRVGGRWVIE